MPCAKSAAFGAMLAFCLMTGERFSSNAIRSHRDVPDVARSTVVWQQPVSTTTMGWTHRMPLARAEVAAEAASLAFLGIALIGAAGFWRRIVRRRQAETNRLAAVPARAAASALRLVQPRTAS